MKPKEKEMAIRMRKSGKTYSEIRKVVPVSKSTLTLWLHSVGLAKKHVQRITKKRIEGQRKAAQAQHNKRLVLTQDILSTACAEIGEISDRELWLIGTALYWAEGSKQHEHSPSTGIIFNNSDVRMINLFLRWLTLQKIESKDIVVELYIHKTRMADSEAFKKWWSMQTHLPLKEFSRVYYKKGNPKTQRNNVGDLYKGLIRIRVRSSTALNRRVQGWINGISGENCRVV